MKQHLVVRDDGRQYLVDSVLDADGEVRATYFNPRLEAWRDVRNMGTLGVLGLVTGLVSPSAFPAVDRAALLAQSVGYKVITSAH